MEGVAQDKRYICMAMEFIRGGELFTYLRETGFFPLKQAQFYIAQIILIFEYLHRFDVVYRYYKNETE